MLLETFIVKAVLIPWFLTKVANKNHINIIEISSSQTAIVVYVGLEDGKKAYELLNEVLE